MVLSKDIYYRIFAICFMFLLLFSGSLCVAGTAPCDFKPADLAGKWKGVLVAEPSGDRIPVDLQVTTEKDELACELDYGPDRNCSSEAVAAGSDEKGFHFRFKGSDGGWCDRLINGKMSLEAKDSGTLELKVQNTSGTIRESVELKRK